MMKRIKVRIDTGELCEQYVFRVPDTERKKPGPRFKTEAEREAHREHIRRRDSMRTVNGTNSDIVTTEVRFDNDRAPHSAEETRRALDNYRRRLLRSCPNAEVHIDYAKGWIRSMGVPGEVLRAKWGRGPVWVQPRMGFDKSGLTVTFNGRAVRRPPEAWRAE